MVGVVLTEIGLDAARAAIGRLIDDGEFKAVLAELVVNQTKLRLDEEKAAPDGTPWPAWSAEYAATRKGRHSLLIGEGLMQASISAFVRGNEISVGSGLVQVATHQFGSEDGTTPARPFLGLSDDNRDEIEDLARDFYEELLQ